MATTELILSSDATRIGRDSRLLAKRCSRGDLIRVRRGAYVPAKYWADLSERERHGIHATALVNTTLTPPIFNLQTSALLWGLGVVGVPKQLCTVTADPRGGRSKHGIRRTLGSLDQGVTQIGNFRVTDKVRTTIELTGALNFAEALAVVDSSRRKETISRDHKPTDWDKEKAWGPETTMDELVAAASSLGTQSKQLRATKILDFSTDKSESVGESISRAQMILLNFPPPTLQGSFSLRTGRIARTDFWWPELDLVGEFDGVGKYLRKKLRGTQTIQEAVLAEKARENALRALGLTVIRWGWAEMMNPRMFARILNDGGLKSLRAA